MHDSGTPLVSSAVIVGAGGHAAVLVDLLGMVLPGIKLVAVDSDEELWGKAVLDVPVVGGDDLLPRLKDEGTTHFVVGVGAVRASGARARLFARTLKLGLKPLTLVHPTAFVAKSCSLSQGCQVMAGAIVNSRAVVGANSLINCGAIVEHDCHIGESVHVATGAQLAGGVVVGPRSLIGIGASVRQGILIGHDCVVGGGSMVVGDMAPQSTAVGVPARMSGRGGGK
jgi:sugar O-acyltransferase (sialic acid O-acetyltransferase NeuD family)